MAPANDLPPEPGAPRARRPRVRLPFVLVGVVAVVLAIALFVWTVVLPHGRPRLEAGERFGVDVSNHQGPIDWDRVARDEIAFAYIKATEGGDFVDAHFRENWDGAARAGLRRGAYHFFTLCRPGADQADNFLAVVPRDDAALPPVVDLEFGGNCSGRPDRETLRRELTTFVERVEAGLGRPLVLYVLEDFEDQYQVQAVLPRAFWIRSLFQRPDGGDWSIWQYSGTALVDGIDGEADLNVARPGFL